MSEPRQASLRRLRQFDVRPNRELGQNFLIDDNLLGVIERAAELATSDVVLEVGGGLGVLSEHLAPRVGHLHVVEIDASLEPALRDALDPFPNTTLHLADAVKLDLGALEPEPTKVVAILPYGVAATVLLESVARLPAATLWVAMVQREVESASRPPPEAAPTAPPPHSRSSRATCGCSAACPARFSIRRRTWTPCWSSCAGARPRRPTSFATWCTPGSPTGARRSRVAGARAGRHSRAARRGPRGAGGHRPARGHPCRATRTGAVDEPRRGARPGAGGRLEPRGS